MDYISHSTSGSGSPIASHLMDTASPTWKTSRGPGGVILMIISELIATTPESDADPTSFETLHVYIPSCFFLLAFEISNIPSPRSITSSGREAPSGPVHFMVRGGLP